MQNLLKELTIEINEINEINKMKELYDITVYKPYKRLKRLKGMETGKEEKSMTVSQKQAKVDNVIKIVNDNCKQFKQYTMPLLKTHFADNLLTLTFKFKRAGYIPIPLSETLIDFRYYGMSTVKPYAESTEIVIQFLYVGDGN